MLPALLGHQVSVRALRKVRLHLGELHVVDGEDIVTLRMAQDPEKTTGRTIHCKKLKVARRQNTTVRGALQGLLGLMNGNDTRRRYTYPVRYGFVRRWPKKMKATDLKSVHTA